MKTKGKRAFSYLRFSDKKQAKGDSLRRQLEWGPALCQARGWDLDGSLLLQDLGVSAFRGRNAATGALSGFLKAIKAGKVKPGDVLLVEALDRLTREDIDPGWEMFRSILKSGVEIYTREPERHYIPADLNNFGTRIEVQAYLLRAYNESAMKSMRNREYWKAKRATLTSKDRRPIHKVLPAWLRLSENRARFEVIPEAARAVRLIYQWAGEGLGLNPITARLNGQKVPAIGRANSWRRSYVAKLLQDKAVVGEYQPHIMKTVPLEANDPDGPTQQKRVPHGDPILDYFPQVIPEAEWYRIRQAVKERGRELGPKGVGVASLFTGLIRDARDGQTMHLCYAGSSRKNNTRILVSYGCRNGEPGSIRMPFPYDAIEKAFLQAVRELKAADILVGGADDQEAEIASLWGKLQELERKIATVQRRVLEEEGIDALVSLLEKLDAEKKATADQFDRLKAETASRQPMVLGEVQSLAALLRKTEGEERRTLRTKIRARIKQLVSEIWVLVWDVTATIRAAEIQIVFYAGRVRSLLLCWLRRGKHRSLVIGQGIIVAEAGKDAHLADKRLRAYRTDPATREFFDRHQETIGPAIQEVVEAEISVREVFAANDRTPVVSRINQLLSENPHMKADELKRRVMQECGINVATFRKAKQEYLRTKRKCLEEEETRRSATRSTVPK